VLNLLTALPLKDIILWFRVILRGFLNYYSFTDNYSKLAAGRATRPHAASARGLAKIYWVLKECLRKTISSKKKMNRSAFLKAFGKDCTINLRRSDGVRVCLDYARPNLNRDPMRFYGTKTIADPLDKKNWKISTISTLGQPCANCGAAENIEMHHIRHIKTINVKLSQFDQMVARVNRKQIPLCSNCHDRVHSGKHAGMSLKNFTYIKWKGQPK
jgi:hypothetical protein